MKRIAFLTAVLAVGCGGGGGGNGVTEGKFYGGVYDVNLLLDSDSCNQVPGDSVVFENTITVNQDETRVVVDIGSYVLEGTANSEGFAALNVQQRGRCEETVALAMIDKSGNTDSFGLSIRSQCGALVCQAVWAGPGTKR